MTKSTTEVGARDMCALTVTARPFPRAIGRERREWPSRVLLATMAALLAPIATVVASGAMSARRHAAALHAEPAATSASSRHAVAGRILDASGNPAPHVSVRVVTSAASRVAGATTDAEGRFRIGAFAPRTFRIVAEDDGDGFVESAEIDADAAHGVVLVLGHAPRLGGTVLDERGAPVPQAVVKSWGGSAATERIVTADDGGRYLFDRVAPGADRITVWARGYEPLVVKRDGSATIDVTLRAAPPIRGHVLGPTGRPVAGARVTACEEAAAEAAISDAAGSFELPASVVGCTLNAAHPRFSSAVPRAIESRADLAIKLGAGGAIEGAVLDDRGEPVNSFSVTIESFDPGDGESQESSRAGESRDELRGSFRFDDLAAGTYVLRAATPEGLASETETVVVARGKVARGIALTFPKPPSEEPVVQVGESGDSE
jgi:protocatechuate 3,4-dioxygenase beta subunit